MKQQNSSINPLNGKIYALVLTIAILIIGTFFYFTAINNTTVTGMNIKSQKSIDTSQKQISMDNSIIENNPKVNTDSKESMNTEDSSIKIQNSDSLFNHILQENRVFTEKDENGNIELFYYHPVDELIDIPLAEGNISEYQIHSIGGQNYYPLILGSEEAKAMREEGEFNNIGDPIKNVHGKNVVVIGVMKKINNAFDMIHITPLTSGELN
jgi:hypothetical protein